MNFFFIKNKHEQNVHSRYEIILRKSIQVFVKIVFGFEFLIIH